MDEERDEPMPLRSEMGHNDPPVTIKTVPFDSSAWQFEEDVEMEDASTVFLSEQGTARRCYLCENDRGDNKNEFVCKLNDLARHYNTMSPLFVASLMHQYWKNNIANEDNEEDEYEWTIADIHQHLTVHQLDAERIQASNIRDLMSVKNYQLRHIKQADGDTELPPNLDMIKAFLATTKTLSQLTSEWRRTITNQL